MYLQVPHNQLAHLPIPPPAIGTVVWVFLLAWTLCTGPATAISIDNDIIGEPDIECLDQEIRVWVKTRKFFAGRIYAKGKSEDPECSKSNFSKDRTQKPHFDLPLGMCGMKSLRSFDPRGMYYGVTLVISFHPLFITKVDQAFHVKCFFEEASRGLTAELGVSMIPTTEVNARHNIMGCSYSIHRSSIVDLDAGRPAGTAIQFAKVGDKVLHQWHCEDPMYGVLINNCYVTDGVNKKAQVIDAQGCPFDPILITGIRYSADLQRAYAESQVFKFADRPGVWFFCQIQMCMKKDGMCDGITPPACATTSKGVVLEGRAERLDGNDGEDNAVRGGSVTEVIPAGVESEIGEPHFLTPTRISTDKIPNDYESYTESTGAPISRGGRKNNARNNGRRGRPSSGSSAPDGYGPVENPSFDDYNNDNEEDATVTPTIFGPGLSPGQDLYASHDAAPKTLFDENKNKTSNVVPPLSIRESATLKLRPPPPHKSTPSNFGRDGILANQEASLSFEANDDLRTSHKGPPGSRNTAPTQPPNTRTTVGEKPRTLATATASIPSSIKKDYADYDDKEGTVDDVELPNNLANILAKLPSDEINAANLQRMFRDSVADRRALLNRFEALTQKLLNKKENSEETPFSTTSPFVIRASPKKTNFSGNVPLHSPGTKIHTLNVDWNSPARDSPLPSSAESSSPSKRNARGHVNEQDTPTNLEALARSHKPQVNLHTGVAPQTIAGQLLIYDLDETPPDDAHMNGSQQADLLETDCALSRVGVTVLASSFSAIIALLTIVIVALLLKIRWRRGGLDGYHRR